MIGKNLGIAGNAICTCTMMKKWLMIYMARLPVELVTWAGFSRRGILFHGP
jgi:hypothetical protein